MECGQRIYECDLFGTGIIGVDRGELSATGRASGADLTVRRDGVLVSHISSRDEDLICLFPVESRKALVENERLAT